MNAGVPDLRAALRRVAQPVAVLLAHDGDEVRAATVTSFMSVALDPPTIAVGLGRVRRVHAALPLGASCSLNILASPQRHIADHFASSVDRETGVQPVRLKRDPDGVPLVPNAVAVLVCKVSAIETVGDHSIVQLCVTSIVMDEEDPPDPLLWLESGYTGVA